MLISEKMGIHSPTQRTSYNSVPVDLVDQPLCWETLDGFFADKCYNPMSGTDQENGWI